MDGRSSRKQSHAAGLPGWDVSFEIAQFVGTEADLNVPIFKRIEQAAIDKFGRDWALTNSIKSGYSRPAIAVSLYLLIKWKRP